MGAMLQKSLFMASAQPRGLYGAESEDDDDYSLRSAQFEFAQVLKFGLNIKLFFIFSFLLVILKNLNSNLYENISLCNTFPTIPSLLKLVHKLNNDIKNKKNIAQFFESDIK